MQNRAKPAVRKFGGKVATLSTTSTDHDVGTWKLKVRDPRKNNSLGWGNAGNKGFHVRLLPFKFWEDPFPTCFGRSRRCI